jgi:hypothetical protein
MNCRHVIGLIDAGPFADYPRQHLDAAWAHARQCHTCGPALEAAAAMTDRLRALPRPALPRDLTAGVLAHTAAIEGARAARPAPVFEAKRRVVMPDVSGWAMVAGAVVATVAITASGDVAPGDIVSLDRVAVRSVVAIPAMTPGLLTLAAGLALYAFGLFASLSTQRPPYSSTSP